MKSEIIKIAELLGQIFSYIYPQAIPNLLRSIRDKIYTGYIKRHFSEFGDSIIMWRVYTLRGQRYIHIGNNTVIEPDVQLTASKVGIDNPTIYIGNNCLIRRGGHITAINNITIGNDLLTGTNVIITDNSHGDTSTETLHTSPRTRIAYSKDGVKIGNNVWLGNNVCVMPGVTIGDGVIIGANSVVTHSIPSNCIAAGVPAKIIKQQRN